MPLNIEKVKSGAPGPGALVGTEAFASWLLTPAARVPPRPSRPGIHAALFDLDGVLVDTAAFHYRAWKQLADELTLPFDENLNRNFRGVPRMACLDLLLGPYARGFAIEEKTLLAERKNGYYLDQVMTLQPADAAPGARTLLAALRAANVRTAVVSASKNARLVLELLHLAEQFDAIVDGNDATKGKPDPQGFLKAATLLRSAPSHCVVIEDGEAGIRAARAAEMPTVGIGPVRGADRAVTGLDQLSLASLDAALPSPLTPAASL
jgi:beta-phosphoglucomutase